MFWVISLIYGVAVMAVATALVFAIVWLVEKLAVNRGRRDYRRKYRLVKWLGPRGSAD
jgi:hypothetical protein